MSSFDNKFQELLDDRSSGSKELLYKFNSLLYQHFDNISDFTSIINIAKNNWKEFQAIQNYILKLNDFIAEGDKNKLFAFIRNYLTTENIVYRQIFDKLYSNIKSYKSFITISNSKTVLEIFTLLSQRKRDIELTISESRPRNEGKFLADNLLPLGLNIIFITEAMIPDYVKKCNAAIIGADSILKNGNIINKVGSKLLAITCRYYKKPIFVIADKSKKKDNNNFIQSEHSNTEILDYNHQNLHIKNYYFEIIEKKLITKIITD